MILIISIFGRENEGFITTVVIGLEGLENLEELDQSPLKLMVVGN